MKIKKIGLAMWLKFAFVDLPLAATRTLFGKMKDDVESLSQHVQEMKYNLFKFQREKNKRTSVPFLIVPLSKFSLLIITTLPSRLYFLIGY